MFTDIMMALIFAILIELFCLAGKVFRQIVIFTSCITIIFSYFAHGCKIDFIGKIDFGVWLVFVILFDIILMIIINKLKQIK